jgi:RES domain-containing protein
MLEAWRIVREKYVETALTGEGAAKYGGRWNLPGRRVVYTSQSKSLAALELLVHLNPPVFFTYMAIRMQFDEKMAMHLPDAELPSDWTVEPPSFSTQRLGSQWVEKAGSALLAVPSVIIREEVNYLINPMHGDFAKIRISPAAEFTIDRRLIA